MGAIEGLSHMTFIVSDLDRMEALLTTVLNARKVYDSGSQTFSLAREGFFWSGGYGLRRWKASPCLDVPITTLRSKLTMLTTTTASLG
jgi:fosfomycin resistance protein FosX